MIIFLYGEDSYRSRRKLNEIVEHYKKIHKSGLNLIQIDARETNFKDFCDTFKIASMFDEKKLIILKNVFSNLKFQEDFLREIKNLENTKDVIVVYEKESLDEGNKLFRTLKKEAKCQEFKLLDTRQLRIWLKEELEKNKAKIDSEAENLLLTFVGNDLWQLASEVKKLANFRMGKLIKKEDVELQVQPKIENDIFKTIDALASKNKKQSLTLLHKHIEAGDNVLYLLSMVAYQFRNLLVIKDLTEKKNSYEAIVKKSGLHPFIVKKNYYLCSRFSLPQLKKIYQRIYEVDYNIKTGKINPEMALDLFIAEI